MSSSSGTPYFAAGYQPGANYSFTQQPTQSQEPPKAESPNPPKKPLTPYMRFSKSVWQQVKAANPTFSVCEVGSAIGRMWRELAEEEKQRHMEDFNKDKVRYDDELQVYLKSQGLRSLKVKPKKKPEPKPAVIPAQRSAPVVSAAQVAQPPPAHSTPAVTQQQQLAQAFMGLPIAGMGGGLPMAVGMPPGMMGMLPHFSQQVWANQQYVGGQQVMQLQLAAQQQQQQQQSAAASQVQELYAANGYVDSAGVLGGSNSQKQMSSSRDRQSTTDYRYPPSYNN